MPVCTRFEEQVQVGWQEAPPPPASVLLSSAGKPDVRAFRPTCKALFPSKVTYSQAPGIRTGTLWGTSVLPTTSPQIITYTENQNVRIPLKGEDMRQTPLLN